MDYKKKYNRCTLRQEWYERIRVRKIEYTDFGLGAIETVQSIGTLENDDEGKMRTFRCRKGLVYYMSKERKQKLSCTIPKRKESYYTVKRNYSSC